METLFYILKSAGILSLFYIVYSVFLKNETLFTINRHFLLFGILAAVVFPLFQFTKTILIEIPVLEPEQISIIATKAPTQQPTAMLFTNFFSFENILIALYILGVLTFLCRFIYQLFSIIFLLKKYSFNNVNGYKFIKVTETISPFSFFNYVVFNPELHPENELGMILAHEKVHAKQYHSIDVLLSNILVAVHWFNPLAWQYKKNMEENLEFIADQKTVKQLDSKKEYQMALVKASAANVLPGLTNNFYKSFIKKRIIMLNKSNSKNRNALKAALVLPLLAGFLWSFNVNEVTKYVEITPEKAEIDTPVIKEEIINPISQTETKTSKIQDPKEIAVSESKKEVRETKKPPIQDRFRTKIDKNTTDARFQEIKEELKNKYGLELSYAAIRNSSNEITSLSLSYSGNGNNGNYQISRDDSIDEFFFFINADGKTGFWSEATEKRRKERLENRKERTKNRGGDIGNRNKDMKEMKEQMEKRRMEMEERREQMKLRRKEMRSNQNSTTTTKSANRVVVNNGGKGSIIINKNTTDAELPKMKIDLATKNIDFDYKNVKRNSEGEITSLKISTKDNNGSKTSTAINGDDDEPIDQIIINLTL